MPNGYLTGIPDFSHLDGWKLSGYDQFTDDLGARWPVGDPAKGSQLRAQLFAAAFDNGPHGGYFAGRGRAPSSGHVGSNGADRGDQRARAGWSRSFKGRWFPHQCFGC